MKGRSLSANGVKNNHIIEAVVTGAIGGGYRLKVSVIDLGLYIDGWTIRSPRENGEWWLQPPAHKVGNRWVNPAEFDKSKSLWKEIYSECLDAVKLYEASTESLSEEDLSEEAISKSLDDAVKALDKAGYGA